MPIIIIYLECVLSLILLNNYLFSPGPRATTAYQHYKRFIALAMPLISMTSVVQMQGTTHTIESISQIQGVSFPRHNFNYYAGS